MNEEKTENLRYFDFISNDNDDIYYYRWSKSFFKNHRGLINVPHVEFEKFRQPKELKEENIENTEESKPCHTIK